MRASFSSSQEGQLRVSTGGLMENEVAALKELNRLIAEAYELKTREVETRIANAKVNDSDDEFAGDDLIKPYPTSSGSLPKVSNKFAENPAIDLGDEVVDVGMALPLVRMERGEAEDFARRLHTALDITKNVDRPFDMEMSAYGKGALGAPQKIDLQRKTELVQDDGKGLFTVLELKDIALRKLQPNGILEGVFKNIRGVGLEKWEKGFFEELKKGLDAQCKSPYFFGTFDIKIPLTGCDSQEKAIELKAVLDSIIENSKFSPKDKESKATVAIELNTERRPYTITFNNKNISRADANPNGSLADRYLTKKAELFAEKCREQVKEK